MYYTYILNKLYAIYKEPLQTRYRLLFLVQLESKTLFVQIMTIKVKYSGNIYFSVGKFWQTTGNTYISFNNLEKKK